MNSSGERTGLSQNMWYRVRQSIVETLSCLVLTLLSEH